MTDADAANKTGPIDRPLAALLASLRRDNRQQSGLAASMVPADLDAAYRAADDVTRELGWPRAGWKIAAIKPQMQRQLRTDRPIYGPVYEGWIHRSPHRFTGRTLLHPLVEMEFVVQLRSDLPPRSEPYVAGEVGDAVATMHPAIEMAECRFVHDAHFPPLPAIIADGCGSGSLVIGQAIDDWVHQPIAGQEVVLRVNGIVKRRGNAADALGHPLEPLTWLANALSRRGHGLLAGQFVSTGTLTGMQLARLGDSVEADFGRLGVVRLSYEPG
ncbi:MAG: fumarylacetoacetate hydrolase family protein [Burkholderiaceae bacterium]